MEFVVDFLAMFPFFFFIFSLITDAFCLPLHCVNFCLYLISSNEST
jgi:hypothetical protein